MYNMREIKEEDFEAVAKFEIEISEISFGEKAITDLEFHCKKLAKVKLWAGYGWRKSRTA